MSETSIDIRFLRALLFLSSLLKALKRDFLLGLESVDARLAFAPSWFSSPSLYKLKLTRLSLKIHFGVLSYLKKRHLFLCLMYLLCYPISFVFY